jgi:hypothetical protein
MMSSLYSIISLFGNSDVDPSNVPQLAFELVLTRFNSQYPVLTQQLPDIDSHSERLHTQKGPGAPCSIGLRIRLGNDLVFSIWNELIIEIRKRDFEREMVRVYSQSHRFSNLTRASSLRTIALLLNRCWMASGCGPCGFAAMTDFRDCMTSLRICDPRKWDKSKMISGFYPW